jgi:short-subunit dehydrogenase
MKDLSKMNVRVAIVDIQQPKEQLPPNVYFYEASITSPSTLKPVADAIRKSHGNPTILINNAGIGTGDTILDLPEASIRQIFEVNIMAHFWTVKEFLPDMIKNDHGHVITIASMASFLGLAKMADYAATKAGALAFHETLTQELRHSYNAKRVRTRYVVSDCCSSTR